MADVLQKAVASSPGLVSVYVIWMHRRVLRIERRLWPDVFGGEK